MRAGDTGPDSIIPLLVPSSASVTNLPKQTDGVDSGTFVPSSDEGIYTARARGKAAVPRARAGRGLGREVLAQALRLGWAGSEHRALATRRGLPGGRLAGGGGGAHFWAVPAARMRVRLSICGGSVTEAAGVQHPRPAKSPSRVTQAADHGHARAIIMRVHGGRVRTRVRAHMREGGARHTRLHSGVDAAVALRLVHVVAVRPHALPVAVLVAVRVRTVGQALVPAGGQTNSSRRSNKPEP